MLPNRAVRPHPELKILLGSQGNVLSSKADLAVIQLDTAVRAAMPPLSLAEADVEAQEALVLVGYGSDEALGWVSDHRHFSQHKVWRAVEGGDDRLLFDQPKRNLYKGDSGGHLLE
ncbi:MAG: hypothetical protein JXB05_35775 [Myxococcaceae bacterium]|nr:hypothetical protein [Myxococcaceae bacterium]